ncbi:hypothetical protein GJV78_04680 [Escherichia alba]|jgi:DNA-binding CsgD family transcriptional regulator|uniref:HTH luxR-type domain-containing protein n=1 Tax=Intestinirhabdus alba TaxID=2899544 RepID=A0A6L6IIQ7_9ENTR|nr:hypothetical protein [Intestinirhabdus alba]
MIVRNFFYIGDNAFCKLSIEYLLHKITWGTYIGEAIFVIESHKFQTLSVLQHKLLLIKKIYPAANVLFINTRRNFLPLDAKYCINIEASLLLWKNKLSRFFMSKSNIDEVIGICSLSYYVSTLSPMALRVTILLAKGYTVSDIAKYISVTEKSIYAYATKIRYKLNLASLVQLCFYLEKEFDAENPALCLPE